MAENLAQLPFSTAVEYWIQSRSVDLAPRSIQVYRKLLKPLTRPVEKPNPLTAFFGRMILGKIRLDHLQNYQLRRQQELSLLPQGGSVKINQELGLLRQLMRRIGTWEGKCKCFYKPIAKSRDYKKPGRSLSNSERERYLMLCRRERENDDPDRAHLRVAAWITTVQLNSTAGPQEMKVLKLEDLHLDDELPWFEIPPRGAKRKSRARKIPLGPEACACLREALARAKACGSVLPSHYLFPYKYHGRKFRKNDLTSQYDPTRGMTSYRVGLLRLLNEAEIRMRPYDFRHTAITLMLEDPGVSDQTAEHMAGWISPDMKAIYSHARMEAMRVAVAVLDTSRIDPTKPRPVQKSRKSQSALGQSRGLTKSHLR